MFKNSTEDIFDFDNNNEYILKNAINKTCKQKEDIGLSDEKSDINAWIISKKTKNKPVHLWGNKDLLKYFKSETRKKFNSDIPPSRSWGIDIEVMAKVGDTYQDLNFSRPSMVEVKEYIDWFVQYYSDILMSKYLTIKWKYLYSEYSVKAFLKYKKDKENSFQNNGFNSKSDDISNEDIILPKNVISDRKRGLYYFTKKYGILFSAIWNRYYLKMSPKESVYQTLSAVEQLVSDGYFNEILNATDNMSPYPHVFNFKSLDKMLDLMAKKTGKSFDLLELDFEKEPMKYTGIMEILDLT